MRISRFGVRPSETGSTEKRQGLSMPSGRHYVCFGGPLLSLWHARTGKGIGFPGGRRTTFRWQVKWDRI